MSEKETGGAPSLSGRLLIATPRTGEPFARAVVLLLHHDEDGAHGVVLNDPTEVEVSAALPDWQPHVTPPGVLFRGGPVGTDTAMGLVSVPGDDVGQDLLGMSLLYGGLGLVDLDAPPPVVAPEVSALRIYVGYAGWGPGQLDGELVAGAWYVVDREARDPFLTDTSTMWRDVLVRQRNTLSLVATYTDQPASN